MGGGGWGRWIAATAAAIALLATAAAPAQLPPVTGEPMTEPARARIVYSTETGLRSINADGSDMRRITQPAEDDQDNEPAWSPDGASVAFSRYQLEEDHDDLTRVWVMRADGSEPRAISPRTDNVYEGSPVWSPDGREIALVRIRLGKRGALTSIVAVNVADGTRRVIHSETSGADREDVLFESPAWSPRGDAILFTRRTFGGEEDDFRPSLRVVPAAGGQARLLVQDGEHGSWSPDAARIAYSGMHDRFGESCDEECIFSGEIYVANADGSDRRRLTTSRAHDADPSWSGDGQRIAFHSDRNSVQAEAEESPPELYSIKPDGTCLTWLTNGTADSEEPAFQLQPGLSSDPGGCGPAPREPLVETDMRGLDSKRAFGAWWLGPVAPNGLLLTDVRAGRRSVELAYSDCGRFDAAECGDFALMSSQDLCHAGAILRDARPGRLRMFRGALLHTSGDDEGGSSDLHTHRTRVLMLTAGGHPVRRALIDALRPIGGERAPGASFPSTRLPVRTWRALREKPAVAKRLAQLGVKRRLGC